MVVVATTDLAPARITHSSDTPAPANNNNSTQIGISSLAEDVARANGIGDESIRAPRRKREGFSHTDAVSRHEDRRIDNLWFPIFF